MVAKADPNYLKLVVFALLALGAALYVVAIGPQQPPDPQTP
jgi:hypothetical protein